MPNFRLGYGNLGAYSLIKEKCKIALLWQRYVKTPDRTANTHFDCFYHQFM